MLIPSGKPYLRSEAPIASGLDRVEMCARALDDLPDSLQEKVVLLDIEVQRAGSTYAIETINQLRPFYPRDEFTLILGSDAAANFDNWYRADALKKVVEILVIRRPGEVKSNFPEVNIDALDISATQVRSAIKSGLELNKYLSPSVLSYINERELYERK